MSAEAEWNQAQRREAQYWESIVEEIRNPSLLLRELAYYAFSLEFALPVLSERTICTAMEMGVGPVGIGALQFVVPEAVIGGVEPLPLMPIRCSHPALSALAEGLTKRVDYQQSQGERLPLPDGSFDAVASVNDLDHTQNPKRILDEMFRTLRPGGVFLPGVNTLSLLGRAKVELERRMRPSKPIVIMHPFSYRHTDLRRELLDRGVRIVFEAKPSRPIIRRVCVFKFAAGNSPNTLAHAAALGVSVQFSLQ